jgi:hypothetical protein
MVEIKSQKKRNQLVPLRLHLYIATCIYTKHPAMFVASWEYPLGLGDYRYWTTDIAW